MVKRATQRKEMEKSNLQLQGMTHTYAYADKKSQKTLKYLKNAFRNKKFERNRLKKIPNGPKKSLARSGSGKAPRFSLVENAGQS